MTAFLTVIEFDKDHNARATATMLLASYFFQKRTLMNKLFSYFCWLCITPLPIMQATTIIRYVTGPLSKTICFIQMPFANMAKWQSLLLFDFNLLSRYIMIIWLKNPASIDDGYW